MDSLLDLNPSAKATPAARQPVATYLEARYKLDVSIVEKSVSLSAGGKDKRDDTVDVGLGDLYKGLSVTAQQVIDKINQLLSQKLPNGVQSLKPEDVTPEATADRIVKGATAFFDAYAKQHSNLSGEDLLNSFLDEVKKGIKSGYDDAYKTLDDLGAFKFDGVKDGVEKTRKLIDDKLATFEAAKRRELGIDSQDTAAAASDDTRSAVLARAGAGVQSSGSINLSA